MIYTWFEVSDSHVAEGSQAGELPLGEVGFEAPVCTLLDRLLLAALRGGSLAEGWIIHRTRLAYSVSSRGIGSSQGLIRLSLCDLLELNLSF